MNHYRKILLASILFFTVTLGTAHSLDSSVQKSRMLSDPFLQLPTENSVRVVWFTEFPGRSHSVFFGKRLRNTAPADTIKLSRIREDIESHTVATYQKTSERKIWRHEAIVTNLDHAKPIPYRVVSEDSKGIKIKSRVFTLAAAPPPKKPLKILLTSDHQLKPMTAANIQKVAETIGKVDAIFAAGDLVNISDRASEWFDDRRGGAFFPVLQGRAKYELEKNGISTTYRGGELIQHAPIFTAIGNHEVMGRYSHQTTLKRQYNNAFPRSAAEKIYQKLALTINPEQDPNLEKAWLKTNSFNTNTYEEIFTLPQSIPGNEKYYAVSFGDIRLVVLYVTNIWRSPSLNPETRGKYQEAKFDLNQPEKWGYGQFIFESITKNSLQYKWLEAELASEKFKQAKYKIVMFHHPPHSLGDNVVPPYTDPVQKIIQTDEGSIEAVHYEYPQHDDYLLKNILPLLENVGVDLVFYGHSHLWNRFISPKGTHFLESSNVGNSYGAYLGDRTRKIPSNKDNFNYAATGDPNGLEAIVPNIDPLLDAQGNPLPYIASNNITVFSILDTSNGTVSSYRFDTRDPKSPVILFDRFKLM